MSEKDSTTRVLIEGRGKYQPLRGRAKHYAWLRFPELYPNRIYTMVGKGKDPIPRGFRTATEAAVNVDEVVLAGYSRYLEPDDVEWISSGSAERPAEDDGGKS